MGGWRQILKLLYMCSLLWHRGQIKPLSPSNFSCNQCGQVTMYYQYGSCKWKTAKQTSSVNLSRHLLILIVSLCQWKLVI